MKLRHHPSLFIQQNPLKSSAEISRTLEIVLMFSWFWLSSSM